MRRLQAAIANEALKLIRRHEEYARELADETERRRRRSSQPPPRLTVLRPKYWDLAPGFNPYIVRSRRKRVSRAISNAVAHRVYVPRNPARYTVPKPDGTDRPVSVFQVADNALSRLIYKNLLRKNRPKLSARSYAYRDDLTAHDAIQYIQGEFARRERLFIAEYDFTQYFESINHDFIRRTLHDERFLLTEIEHEIIEAFLQAPPAMPAASYTEAGGNRRERGIPLGTSVSLFLANVAASPLDRALEQLGVGFVRYADDTLIWSPDYGTICRAVDELYEASRRMGAELNPEKSSGIRVLVGEGGKAEIKKADHVGFVGYQVALRSLEMKETTIKRVKKHLRLLLYYNLLFEPFRGTQDAARLGRVDRDYVTFLWQARRYLYGDLSEKELRAFDRRGTPLRKFKGLMSYYPLLDDTPSLRKLDSWLLTETWLALRKRSAMLIAAGVSSLPPPHGLSRDELAKYQYKSRSTGGTLDMRLPSFRRIAAVVRRASRRYGPNAVGHAPTPYDY